MGREIVRLGVGLLTCLAAASATAQVPRPSPRGNGNDHKTSGWQDPLTTRLAEAWALCLAPHLGDRKQAEICNALEGILQNQYSDHATYDFYERVGDLLWEDLDMNGHVSGNSVKEELRPGGLLVPLVDALLAQAVATSGGVLRFDDSTGGTAFREQHDLLMRKDPALVASLLGLLKQGKLDKEAKYGMEELAARTFGCLRAKLPLADENPFHERVKEVVQRTSPTAAVEGVRARLRCSLTRKVRGARSLRTVQEHIELRREVEAFVDQHVPQAFWTALHGHHERMLTDPKAHRKALKKTACEL